MTGVANNAALCGAIAYNEGDGAPYFENIRISDSTFKTDDFYAGAFVGDGYAASFKNCHVYDCDIYAERFVGGIAGMTYGDITDCSVKGTTKETMKISSALNGSVWANSWFGVYGDNAGGIVGLIGEGGTKVSNCTVDNITVIGTRQVGGIAGLANYGDTISGCVVSNANIKAYLNSDRIQNNCTAAVGGVCGQIQTGSSVVTVAGNTVGPDVSVSQQNGSTRYCGWAVGDATRAEGNTSLYNISNVQSEGWISPINEIGS